MDAPKFMTGGPPDRPSRCGQRSSATPPRAATPLPQHRFAVFL